MEKYLHIGLENKILSGKNILKKIEITSVEPFLIDFSLCKRTNTGLGLTLFHNIRVEAWELMLMSCITYIRE